MIIGKLYICSATVHADSTTILSSPLMQHIQNSWDFQDVHKVRAKDPQAWSRPWNFVKGWPTGAVDWSTVKCLSRKYDIFKSLHDLKISAENHTATVNAKDWLQHHAKQQLLIVHWTIFHIMKIEVFKSSISATKKCCFLLGFRIAFGAQVAALRSWQVVGAPPRPSARPASGHRRPSGTAARAAPPWRRAAAPRRLGKATEMSLFVEGAQTKRLQISF